MKWISNRRTRLALAPANITVKLKQIFFSSAQISFPQVIFAWVLFCCISISAVAFDFVGPWDMDHDGWHGMLVIYPPDQIFNEIDGNCTYWVKKIDGTYTKDGADSHFTGRVGGKDENLKNGTPCPKSDHLIEFFIEARGEPSQRFVGYFFGHENGVVPGITWWHGIPSAGMQKNAENQ